jgi:ribosomal RNA-processing protein 7
LQKGDCDSNDEITTEETFFYVREHQGRAAENTNSTNTNNNSEAQPPATLKKGTTLFVANAPIVPGVSTKLLLQSIFGRFADVTRVTVVQNPRAAARNHQQQETEGDASSSSIATTTETTSSSSSSSSTPSSSLLAWSEKDQFFQPTFLPHILSSTEGKYAHVVFSTPKEMKKAKKALEEAMTNQSRSHAANGGSRKRPKGRKHQTTKEDKEEEETQRQQCALILDKLELQTLSDESLRQRKETIRKAFREDEFDSTEDFGAENSDDVDNAFEENDADTTRKHAAVLAVAKRYKESCQFLKSRAQLLEECNSVMQAYEDAEEAKRLAHEAHKAQPDDDGFVTVSYSKAVGSKVDFEESATATTPSRRKGNKRSRKKKEAAGSTELQDFYRFQRADNRKRTMEDLRRKFEEDVRKVKRLKEEKQYRPF